MKIKSKDTVKVIAGKDKGKTGNVVQVMKNTATNQVYVVVEGVNLLKKHMKPRQKGDKGQVIELPAPIHVSKVMLIDGKSGKPTRVGYKMEGNEKKRIAKKSNEYID